jgi:hypothetical protein
MMIKKISKPGIELHRTALVAVKGGVNNCVCDCDSPGCTDWISQVAAIGGAAASYIFEEPTQ